MKRLEERTLAARAIREKADRISELVRSALRDSAKLSPEDQELVGRLETLSRKSAATVGAASRVLARIHAQAHQEADV